MNVRQIRDTYISRKGQRLRVSLDEPEIKKFLVGLGYVWNWSKGLDGKVKDGLSVVKTSMKYDQKAQQNEYVEKYRTASSYNASAGLLFYSTNEKIPATASLGQMMFKNGMVCREKAVLTHLFLAELGIPTFVQPGTVQDGAINVEGHVWTEWVEPVSARLGTAQAYIDGTWAKVYTNYSADKFIVERLKREVFFEPINALDPEPISIALAALNSPC